MTDILSLEHLPPGRFDIPCQRQLKMSLFRQLKLSPYSPAATASAASVLGALPSSPALRLS
ncbi:MAG: hypothetical protein ACYCOR_20930, partial [Acidobacteriaceae bacterium]